MGRTVASWTLRVQEGGPTEGRLFRGQSLYPTYTVEGDSVYDVMEKLVDLAGLGERKFVPAADLEPKALPSIVVLNEDNTWVDSVLHFEDDEEMEYAAELLKTHGYAGRLVKESAADSVVVDWVELEAVNPMFKPRVHFTDGTSRVPGEDE